MSLNFALQNAHIISAAGNDATLVIAGKIKLAGWDLANMSTGWRFVKVHDLAVSPTPGQSVAKVVALPPGGKSTMFWGQAGIELDNGLAFTLTAGPADSDTSTVALNDVVGEIYYYVFEA